MLRNLQTTNTNPVFMKKGFFFIFGAKEIFESWMETLKSNYEISWFINIVFFFDF